MKVYEKQTVAGKLQGDFFHIENLDEFAKNRCEMLNGTEEAKKYNHNYTYVIAQESELPKKLTWELYTPSAINSGDSEWIAIYREFKSVM